MAGQPGPAGRYVVWLEMVAQEPSAHPQQQLDALLGQLAVPAGVRLRWLRGIGPEAQLVALEGLGSPTQAQAVMQALARLPGVVRVEPDLREGIGPGPQLPRLPRVLDR